MAIVWSDTFTDTNGDPWDAAKWTTGQNGTGVVDIQSNRGRMLAQGGAFAYCRALSDMAAIADQQVLVSFEVNSTSEQYWAVSLRHSGVWDAGIPANPNDGYWFEAAISGDILSVHKGVGGTRTDIDDVAFNWNSGVRYWMRAEAVGTTIRARVWEDGDPEPGGWLLSITDASHSSGVVALSGSNGGDSAARTITWDDFAVDDLTPVTYFTDFSEYSTGTPTGWTERWTVAGGTPTIENSGLPSGAGVQALKIAAGTSAPYALSWDAVGTPAGDVDVLMRCLSSHTSDVESAFRLHIHGSGGVGSENAYISNARTNIDTLQFFKYVGFSATVFATPAVTMVHDVWYWMRLQITGTTVQTKVWEDGDPEPGSWTASTTDTSLGSGWVGIGESTADGTLWVSQIGVGLYGEAAPDTAPGVSSITVAPYIQTTPEFRLAIFPPLASGRTERLDNVSIDPQVTSLQWSSTLPGGFSQLSVGIERIVEYLYGEPVRYSRLPERVHTQPFNHVQLWANSALVFEGRMGPDSGQSDRFTVNGYWSALQDSHFTSTDTTAGTTGSVLRGVLSNAAPIISPASGDNWQDPQVSHTPADYDGMKPRSVLDQVVQEGTSAGSYMDWAIWERRALALTQRAAPTQPDYLLAFDEGRMQWVRDPSELRSAVMVEYTATDNGSATVTSGSTSVTVAHVLGFTPDEEAFRVTALTELGAATAFHIENIDSNSFDIVLTAPNANSGLTTITSGNTFVAVTHGLGTTPTADEIRVTATSSLGAGSGFYVDTIGATTFRINLYQEERNTGSATIASGTTSIAVTHGMSRTPLANEILLTPTNGPTNDPGNIWVSTIGATQFTINCRNNPGVSGASFNWAVRFQNVPEAHDPGAVGASFAWEIVQRDNPVPTAPGASVTFAWAIEAPGTRTDWAESTTFADRWGITKREIIPAGRLTTAAAESIRDTILAESQDVKHSINIDWPFDDPLRGPQGQPRAPWLVRAGQWIQVADAPLLPIVNADVDPNAGRVRLEVGNRFPSWETVLADLQRDTETRRQGLSPVTGGRI